LTILLLASTPLIAPLFSQRGEAIDDTANRFNVYSAFWAGSISTGNAHTIGIQSTVTTYKPVYVDSITVLSDVNTTVAIRKGAANTPTTVSASFGSTASPSLIGMNTAAAPIFRFWPVSDIADGGLITQYPLFANEPRTIGLTAALLNTGRSSGRNISVHFAAAAGNAQVTVVALQLK
jgi:hypothetical protein